MDGSIYKYPITKYHQKCVLLNHQIIGLELFEKTIYKKYKNQSKR